MRTAWCAIIVRDIRLGLRQDGGAGAALAFILCVLVLLPLAVGPDQNLLRRLAPGFIWLSLLLAVLLTAERIFQQDYEDGSIDVLMTIKLPLELVCLAKGLAHWLTVSLPLAILAPLLALLVNIDSASIPSLWLGMIPGSLALSLLASMGGAIAAGLRRGGLLVTLLIMPFYIPVLIFGVAATAPSTTGNSTTSALLLLCAISLFSLALQPLASAAAIRAYFR